MVLDKNSNLIVTPKRVQIKSVDQVVSVPILSTFYSTPSKIQYTISSAQTQQGNLHTKKLQIHYPGLSTEDFKKFSSLIRGVYQVFIKLHNNEVYEIATPNFPMVCSSSFNLKTGHQLNFSVVSPKEVSFLGIEEDSEILEKFDWDFNFNLT
ncbi:hypothetical protein M1M27_gp29 [Cellulophaga phage Ingeline_1]|uniref:Uncharacterized protein n=1 Tax=Cellulophaga phage Ingeline_1 TaxID=2745674 RepID=A0A8E4ZIG1_9CAUD|nr:hypothetical protein M1M27_gp29 [Cellulophaga phage Ingeline_1]QQV90009.1 hypothetical protein Ingeline2_22 [Cellulophaga phage Ingeline_2]QQV90059.1 hypothetical protein Ingeline3_22 [Cellulophaga phage Ingeline_3]QQV90109.1 hypothetical protein Ingeline4_22 [Cellulophaga phage Ingeline_4]QQV90159.1 hypothetical protein Ingeline5_22 [Cellulophaga phage Ingeline_5]QQV90208.1 hypothetical protein Ingeline6_22 [Cellulophaga phage Ingeline_6]QQV90258.1 hypothetical protein Ingeline7_22 [Cellu